MMKLTDLFDAGVQAVRGDTSVTTALARADIPPPDQIIAVGKAATAMARAAHAHFGAVPLLIVTKYDHGEGAPDTAEVIEAAHPVLDENSLRGGARVLETVAAMPQDSHLLMLVSGGASALAEAPVDGLTLEGLSARANELLGSGADIHAMNKVRKTLSRIKGGKLLSEFKGARVTTLAISDVEGDALGIIGSGIGDAESDATFMFAPQIVASNRIAREAVVATGKAAGIDTLDGGEILYDDIGKVAPVISSAITAAVPGVLVFGGEPTVVLPPNPGKGGRNQALALMIAREIAGMPNVEVLVAGTDGTDGPTDAAGAIVTGETWEPSADDALARADAGSWLEARGALLRTGPTGTNVMDLVIARKS